MFFPSEIVSARCRSPLPPFARETSFLRPDPLPLEDREWLADRTVGAREARPDDSPPPSPVVGAWAGGYISPLDMERERAIATCAVGTGGGDEARGRRRSQSLVCTSKGRERG